MVADQPLGVNRSHQPVNSMAGKTVTSPTPIWVVV